MVSPDPGLRLLLASLLRCLPPPSPFCHPSRSRQEKTERPRAHTACRRWTCGLGNRSPTPWTRALSRQRVVCWPRVLRPCEPTGLPRPRQDGGQAGLASGLLSRAPRSAHLSESTWASACPSRCLRLLGAHEPRPAVFKTGPSAPLLKGSPHPPQRERVCVFISFAALRGSCD